MANRYVAGRERAAVRRPARVQRDRPAGTHRHIRPITCPFTGEVLTAVPALRPGRRRSSTRSAPTATATCRCGASPACRRRQCSPRAGRSSPSRRSSTSLTPEPGAGRAAVLGRRATSPSSRAGAHPSYAQGYSVARQRLLPRVGRDQPGPRHVRPLAGRMPRCCAPVARHADELVRADEMMTVAAARQLHDGAVCFVGIGLPSTAANLARAHARTGPRAHLRVGDARRQADPPAAVHRRRHPRRHRRRGRQRARGVQLLAAARADRRRVPRRRAARPVRQHQHDRDRRRLPTSPKVRLPGAGGAPEIAASCRRGRRRASVRRRVPSWTAWTSSPRSASAHGPGDRRAARAARGGAAHGHHRPRRPAARPAKPASSP